MSDKAFTDLLAKQETIVPVKKGELIKGTIVHVGKKLFLVDINNQFTGIISGSDLITSVLDVKKLKAGDEVEALYRGQDPESGLLILSLRKASQLTIKDVLRDNQESGKTMTVVATDANKGGLLVNLDGMKGFIPVSQLSPMNYPRVEGADPEKILAHLGSLVGKPLEVQVLNVDDDGKKIIFSERATEDAKREEMMKKLKVGDRVEGVVSGILSYGLFVTFDGLEGLVHVSEIDWGHVPDPSKFAKIGDKVNVEIIGLEPSKISLSIKRLKSNPWEELSKNFKVGDVVEVPVIKISKFGVFVEMMGGINGLIHLSELTHGVVNDPNDYVQIGKNVKAKIIALDTEEKRVGLSLKVLETPPAGMEAAPMAAESAKVDKSKEADLDVEADVKEEKKAPAKKTAAKKEEKEEKE